MHLKENLSLQLSGETEQRNNINQKDSFHDHSPLLTMHKTMWTCLSLWFIAHETLEIGHFYYELQTTNRQEICFIVLRRGGC